ncbi:MAG: 50S ribosomal protein L10 [Candidatus Niyogibacteria bacterium]|nr:50S ribosomal protein L10 [Candidatus Niyogibacteria bacterium]
MAITRIKKEQIINDLHKAAEHADMIVFLNFHKVSVADMSALRNILRKAGAALKVAKKRLAKRVLDGLGLHGDMPKLEGEVALFFKEGEPVEAVKVLSDFAKKFEGMKILGGVYERGYVGADIVKMLASIPPRDVLFGQVVGGIASPIRGFMNVINGPLAGLVGVLHNITKSRI